MFSRGQLALTLICSYVPIGNERPYGLQQLRAQLRRHKMGMLSSPKSFTPAAHPAPAWWQHSQFEGKGIHIRASQSGGSDRELRKTYL